MNMINEIKLDSVASLWGKKWFALNVTDYINMYPLCNFFQFMSETAHFSALVFIKYYDIDNKKA